jgi:hypothetical protein
MKKRILNLIVTTFLLISLKGFSQSNALLAPRFETNGLSDISLQNNFNSFIAQTNSQFTKGQLAEFTGLGGTQRYFSNVWVSGAAMNPQGVTIGKPYVFNFDFKEHELYAQWKDTAIVVNSNYLKAFMLMDNGQPHYFVREPAIHLTYFLESIGFDPELKTEPKVQLLKLRKVVLKKTNKNDYAATFSGDYSDKIVSEIEYYISQPDHKFSKIKLSKKAITAALPEYAQKFNEYFASNPDKLDDGNAVNLIKYLNQ